MGGGGTNCACCPEGWMVEAAKPDAYHSYTTGDGPGGYWHSEEYSVYNITFAPPSPPPSLPPHPPPTPPVPTLPPPYTWPYSTSSAPKTVSSAIATLGGSVLAAA